MKIKAFVTTLILATSFLFANAATNSYTDSWKKVDDFQKKSLPASAKTEVDKIYNDAVKTKNYPQIIKTLIYNIDFQRNCQCTKEEWPQMFSVIEKLTAESTHKVEQAMLHSMLAEMYAKYYQDNTYKINQRTAITDYVPDNMDEWSKNIFTDKMVEHINASLQPEAELIKTSVITYSDILTLGDDSRNLRPTLFDFLSYRALDLLSGNDFIPQGINVAYFAEAAQFDTIHTNNNYANKKIIIYQNLLKAHQADTNQDAMLYADLERLKFVYNNSDIESRDSLYLQRLSELKKHFANNPLTVEIMIQEANYYLNNERNENNEKVKRSKNLIHSYNICQQGIDKYPQYKRINLLKNIQLQIEQPALQCSTDNLVYPQTDITFKVTYNNLKNAVINVYKVDKSIETYTADYNSSQKSTGKLVFTKNIDLPEKERFVEQTLTITGKGLDNGIYEYEIVSKEKPSSSYKGTIYVSRYTLIQRARNNKIEYYVVDRKTGHPEKNASVKIYENKYINGKRTLEPIATIACNANGYATYTFKNNQDIYAGIATNDDYCFPLTNKYAYKSQSETIKPITNISIFTDRGIYRPGQTVYFKAIAYNQTTTDVTVIKDKTLNIKLLDANYQEIATKTLKTNEFGSLAGEFILPQNVLSGYFTIQCNNYSQSFRVEEYKRPSIEITIDNIKGAYSFGDSISLTGTVMNYAGYAASNAALKYRVTERPTWFGYKMYPIREQEITNGSLFTDEKGKFSIPFVPQKRKEDKEQANYNYTLYVETTDSKGETQKHEFYFNVSDNSILLEANMPAYIKKESKTSITISAQNNNNEKLTPAVDYLIFEIQPKKSIADTAVVIGKKVLSGIIDLSKNNKLENNLFNTLPSGKYRLQLTAKDEKGRESTFKKDFILYAATDTKLADKEYIFTDEQKTTCAIGENAEILFGTSASNVKVLYQLLKDQELLESKWLDFNDELRLLQIPYKEEYGDKVTLELTFIKDEKFFNKRITITKKEENKALDIKFTTFRDKLLPGQQEEWTVKILDSKGKIVNAELMATLYDASLDAFGKHIWNFNPAPYVPYKYLDSWDARMSFQRNIQNYYSIKYKSVDNLQFDVWNWFNAYNNYRTLRLRGAVTMSVNEVQGSDDALGVDMAMKFAAPEIRKDEEVTGITSLINTEAAVATEESAAVDQQKMQIRENFNETAFFYPQLKTNANGEVLISFKIPESLTRWNFMGLAHTQGLEYGQLEANTITQKPFMITANMPRFVRVDDKLTLTANIVNLTENAINGQATLAIVNPVDEKVIATQIVKFDSKANSTIVVSWNYDITNQYDMFICRVTAQNNQFSDGEQHLLPVLSNKVLITESMPMNIKGNETKTFSFDNMKKASSTVENKRYTVEFTSNPVWYAVQALPYVSTPASENALSIFSAYYVDALGSYIVNANPKIKTVFDLWKKQNISKDALLSNLEKNEELKNILLEETPWVMDAKNEGEQKQRIALFFDLNNLTTATAYMFDKLKEMQLPNGAFPWFKGMGESRYITQQLLDGMAKLKQTTNITYTAEQDKMQRSAVKFIDIYLKNDLEQLKKVSKNYKTEDQLTSSQIYYHYIRSSYKNIPVPSDTKEAFDYYLNQMEKYWTKQGLYEQAMIALTMNRNGKKDIANDILKSLRENAKVSDEMGMYWEKNRNSYYWYQSAIKTQGTLIEAFAEIGNNKTEIDNLKIWLLKQKQTQLWESDVATINAIQALLMQGGDWTESTNNASITVGGQTLYEKTEAGTGYIKKTYENNEIKPDLANITITNNNNNIAWGAAYWQYLENIDKVEKQTGSLSVNKKLFVERMNNKGKYMEPVTGKTTLKTGDKVIVRLSVGVDRDMEYVCLKDLRGACFEPVEQLSGYRWREGLGYYQSTKDASMQYFFNYLPKGNYVLEYGVWVTRVGEYSNGMATIQCQYAPEFAGHSGSEKIVVK